MHSYCLAWSSYILDISQWKWKLQPIIFSSWNKKNERPLTVLKIRTWIFLQILYFFLWNSEVRDNKSNHCLPSVIRIRNLTQKMNNRILLFLFWVRFFMRITAVVELLKVDHQNQTIFLTHFSGNFQEIYEIYLTNYQDC